MVCIKFILSLFVRKNIFACLFSVHNTISLSRHEQVCLMRLRFERYFSHHRASLNILVHDVINLLYLFLFSVKKHTTERTCLHFSLLVKVISNVCDGCISFENFFSSTSCIRSTGYQSFSSGCWY